MRRFAEIGLTAAGVGAGLFACGFANAVILGVLCWGAFRTVRLRMVALAVPLSAMMTFGWLSAWIAFNLRSVAPPDNDIYPETAFAMMVLSIIGGVVGGCLACRKRKGPEL